MWSDRSDRCAFASLTEVRACACMRLEQNIQLVCKMKRPELEKVQHVIQKTLRSLLSKDSSLTLSFQCLSVASAVVTTGLLPYVSVKAARRSELHYLT